MKTVRKAIAAAVVAGGAALGTAMLDGQLDGGEVTAAAGAALIALALVYRVPNAAGAHQLGVDGESPLTGDPA